MIGKVSCYGIELSFVTDRKLEESQLNALIGWLEAVIATIREFENVNQEER